MSKYLSDKWFVETLRYLLPPDTKIHADDGAVIIYCNDIDWECDGEQHAEQLADVLREIQKQGGKA